MSLKKRFLPWEQLQDKVNSGISWITKESDQDIDFYPRPEKRRYFEGGEVYLSMSLRDGSLFGGCTREVCSNRSVAIDNFCPTGEYEKNHFDAALKMHSIAVLAGDLDVARENRRFLEKFRSETCSYCLTVPDKVSLTDTINTIDSNTHTSASSESSSSTTEGSEAPEVNRSEENTTQTQDSLSSS